MTVTAAKSIMSFWVLPVTVNLNGLATGAMKVNCDHERTLKATIIPLIQLIGGITRFSISGYPVKCSVLNSVICLLSYTFSISQMFHHS
ncbi:glutamate decarboxylase [Salmonella enterica]|nr:glutamate decarboxylase [Salmonella enterica]EAB7210839.1 glutamate decarboxylase [Salmonella enterica subsp. enterica serovar Cotham]EBQ8820903.1 glutamate decarboxylase [Salmonella enterica subsp. enterica serovar Kisarawe]EBV3374360.1 glutamate decarboxylase [Salmonella enterica subsp. enterica serovar Senftenberg]EBW6020551.1 glutamate decarboxylase [Salmonella enterica subsp. enterica serovar Infantis]EBX3951694.1 glutamate decarboxylase [Salmonella enterica subsp. enterica serovar Off